MTAPRFVIGIDLGTTNCALAYVDTGKDTPTCQSFVIPQVVKPGLVEERPLLPSFLYLPNPNEQPAGAMNLPWSEGRDYAVGEFARDFGSQVPTRLVASAKSWLCHAGVDRRAAILPFRADEHGRKISPLEASTCYLKHLAEAWNFAMAKDVPAHRLELQDIILTVPASFDAVARELTVEAARAAGFENLTLLEEPQAAFYAWLNSQGDHWRNEVRVGDLFLVADVGGGTTDFTLIEVSSDAGNLNLTRIAVGDHLLLGGDNMDLALAHVAAQSFAAKGAKLDSVQLQQLAHSTRQAKEILLADPTKSSAPITVLGRGSRVIGGTLKGELTRAEVDSALIDGFFPMVPRDSQPARGRPTGLQELGLPYVADPAITKHLAHFLIRQTDALRERGGRDLPSAVLFNGGVFKSPSLRQRLLEVLNSWGGGDVRALQGTDLDQSVARGAAYYGVVRRGKGIRIRGGTARAYYIGVETAMPAVPGIPTPIKALCVAPFGMEEGTETDIPAQEFGLVVGEPAEFRFLGSTTRRHDTPGATIEDWQDEIEELGVVSTTMIGENRRVVPVHLHTKVTEVGQLELWCYSRDSQERWKLEYNTRDTKPT